MLNKEKSRYSSGKTILLTLFLCITALQISNAQWVQSGTFAGTVQAMLTVQSADASGNDIIYLGLGDNEGVWKSTDDGNTWTETNLDDKSVYSLAASGSYVFAGTDQDGIYFSSNGGNTWNQTPLNNRTVYAFTESGGYLYAGTKDYGVYCSANNGITWFQTSLNNRTVKSLTSSGSSIYAGTLNYGLYKSTNYGTNWAQTPLSNLHIVSIVVNGNNNDLLAGTDNGLWKSTDFGSYWSQCFADFEVLAVILSGGTIITGTDGGVRISYDNGTSWLQRNEGFTGAPFVRTIRVSGNHILAGVGDHRDAAVNNVYRRPLDEIIGIVPISNQVPEQFSLSQNYPNPFNPSTSIRFSIPANSNVKLAVFNSAGQEVANLVNESMNAGTYEYQFDAGKLSSGVYFYKLITDNFTDTKKMMLVK